MIINDENKTNHPISSNSYPSATAKWWGLNTRSESVHIVNTIRLKRFQSWQKSVFCIATSLVGVTAGGPYGPNGLSYVVSTVDLRVFVAFEHQDFQYRKAWSINLFGFNDVSIELSSLILYWLFNKFIDLCRKYFVFPKTEWLSKCRFISVSVVKSNRYYHVTNCIVSLIFILDFRSVIAKYAIWIYWLVKSKNFNVYIRYTKMRNSRFRWWTVVLYFCIVTYCGHPSQLFPCGSLTSKQNLKVSIFTHISLQLDD